MRKVNKQNTLSDKALELLGSQIYEALAENRKQGQSDESLKEDMYRVGSDFSELPELAQLAQFLADKGEVHGDASPSARKLYRTMRLMGLRKNSKPKSER